MSDIKKFLDYEGVQHLWSKINMNDYPNNETLMAVINAIDETKVDKIDGKGLSTNDFTSEYKEKLDGLENITFEETDPTVPAWAKKANKPTYTAQEVGALPADTIIPTVPTKVSAFTNDAGYLTQHQSLTGYATETYANTAVSNHNINNSAHNDIRLLIEGLTNRLNTLADSDDTTLDQMSEIVTYIKSNKSLIEDVTTNKVNVTDIINNLTTNVTNKPLSAAQGVAIKGLIDALQEELDTHTHFISEVSGLQSALDGKAPSSHGTHVSYSSTAPVMDGTASAGSASTVARSDHKHPTDTSRASKSEFDTHTGNTTVHITSTERTNWNAAKSHANSAHAPSNAQPNQKAFSNIAVGSTIIAADSTTDTLTLVGSNVTITPDATNDKVTIGITKANVTSALGYTPPTTNTTYGEVSTTAAGLAPKRDGSTSKFLRADGTWAVPPDTNTVYTHPTSSGNKHIPSGGSSGQILRWNSDGTAVWDNENDTTYDIATDSKNGLMSSSMVTKLEGIDPGANKTIVDESLSSTSTNPVQNKVINNALANKQPLGDYALKSELGNFLPEVTSSNNGQILRVIDGVWAATLLPNAEDGKF